MGKDFYECLGKKESEGLGGYKAENKGGYIGKYQMSEIALVDAGYYVKENKKYNHDWKGIWTKKAQEVGVNSKTDFKKHPEVQEKAVRIYHEKVWGYLKDYHKYEGRVINGILITKSGMIAASTLGRKGK